MLPMLDLIENAQAAVDDLIDVMGRATIEAVLLMSAAQLAGPKQQGKKVDRDVAYHGSQAGRVALKERQLKVTKPRLRKKAPKPGEAGEVEIPAYEAMRKDGRLADRMLEILIAGVSTRRYQHVLPEMAETVGVSRSEVSCETIEAGERLLKELAERDLSGSRSWPSGSMASSSGHTTSSAPWEWTPPATSTFWGCGRGPRRTPWWPRRCWRTWSGAASIPSGVTCSWSTAKALRCAIDTVFGADQPVQRCRNHKLRNVVGHLPDEQHEQAKATLRAAFKLDAMEGTAKLEQYASWLERQWPDAAASLREGIEEIFTINRLGLPSVLRRCLGTTNIIDNGHSAARDRMRRVKNCQSGSMALRWTAAAFAAASKGFRRIMGHEYLWMHKAALEEPARDRSLVQQAAAG